MAGRLTNAASRILGGNGVVCRSVASSLRLRSGMGLPVGKHYVPDKPLPMNDELVWDNGTPFPEPCIDRIADTVGKYEALAWLCGGLSFFASLGLLAVWNDKASKIPFRGCKEISVGEQQLESLGSVGKFELGQRQSASSGTRDCYKGWKTKNGGKDGFSISI
uniref:NADH dehydrogenase [ubiquinone] 1 beta subcomplex subunit 8, mitochondrial n=1 Tax=Cajanus cajan TaxID=3821 RepID=A0A151SKR1_CAJCA|nr:hypothetical protein KK1_001554 [Cajanus cajan]